MAKSMEKLTEKQSESSPVRVTSTAPKPLSPKEKVVLEFLESYMASKGISPTYQEICEHFGFASFNSVQRYLKQLESKGYIQLPWSNQKRAITILQSAATLQNAVDDLRTTPKDERQVQPHHFVGNAVPKKSSRESLTPALLSSENFTLPLLGRVAAGAPIEALEHDEFIDVPASLVRRADLTYALRVQGESMIEDGILDGDVILVQRQTSASNGEIVVAMIGEEATVKRFYLHRGDSSRERSPSGAEQMIELRPANSTMSPMWFEPNEVQVRGVVVGLIRRFF